MALFTKDELRVIGLLAANKRLSEDDKPGVEDLKVKLGAASRSDIPERFAALTGWANDPKDYPA